MRLVVITGLSGAGKSLVVKYMEDIGYFCADNLPPELIPKFVAICSESSSKKDKVALVTDIRGGELLNDLFPALEAVRDAGFDYEILFLEATDETLINRYKESRRAHPLAPDGRIVRGIGEERKFLENIRCRADYIIDTSKITIGQLKDEINNIFIKDAKTRGMLINIISFGFKHGIPIDCDLLFDMRFIPNPYYVASLKKLSGKNEAVRDFVMKCPETSIFLTKIIDLLDFLIPGYMKEGKTQLVIGIGCTGGRHRSVVIGDSLYKTLSDKKHSVDIEHRDIEKDSRKNR